jgi:CHAT domain-containing protein
MPVDDTHLNYGSLKYAINDFQISLANSATILTSTGFSRKKMKPANIFAGFAPDYSGIAESDTLDNQFMAVLVRSGNLQLPGASEEVNLIANLVKGNAFTGAKATEKLFKEVAGNYKILHLAMHGLIDDLEPLNSELVFTPVQDSINDGYLNLSEVYNLRLHSELVVLSACNTGVGKIQKGEGNMSLSRAFRYAGSEGIIMSLWKVPDEATSEIMVDFYKNILNEKTKDQSLREAKLAFLKKYADDPLQSHPFFWAGFVPIGIMKPVELESNYFLVISFILGTMLLVLIIYSFRRRMSNRSVG